VESAVGNSGEPQRGIPIAKVSGKEDRKNSELIAEGTIGLKDVENSENCKEGALTLLTGHTKEEKLPFS